MRSPPSRRPSDYEKAHEDAMRDMHNEDPKGFERGEVVALILALGGEVNCNTPKFEDIDSIDLE